MKIQDTGTRFAHYRELQDLWEEGITVLRRMESRSKTDLEMLAQLEIGVFLVRKQIDILTRYQPGQYSDALFPLKQQIDEIPTDPNKIPI